MNNLGQLGFRRPAVDSSKKLSTLVDKSVGCGKKLSTVWRTLGTITYLVGLWCTLPVPVLDVTFVSFVSPAACNVGGWQGPYVQAGIAQ